MIIHGQLPLPVPCYDLALLTEPTLGPPPNLPHFLFGAFNSGQKLGGGTLGIPSSVGLTGECSLEIQS